MLLIAGEPLKKDGNGHNTDFSYYNNKYEDYWEQSDSIFNRDTIYIYKLGGQKFKFYENGKLVVNNKSPN